jgi:hypothetical protein
MVVGCGAFMAPRQMACARVKEKRCFIGAASVFPFKAKASQGRIGGPDDRRW